MRAFRGASRLTAFSWSIVLGIAAAAANLFGAYVVTRRKHWHEIFLKDFIGLGAGFMLAAVFLRLLPESLELTPLAPALILLGYFLVHFFEHTLAPHFHFGEETHGELMLQPAVAYSAVVGLTIHTFFDGVSIASGFLVSLPLGVLIFLAVALHKFPEGFTVASIALASGRGARGAWNAALTVAGATLLGVLVTHSWPTGVTYALPVSTGVTLYVAASDLIPEVNEQRGPRMALVVFLGVALFGASSAALTALGITD